MVAGNFTDDFKHDAFALVSERGYPVAEVAKRLGGSQHSHYAWKRKFAKPSGGGDGVQAAEIRRLQKKPPRVTEGRDILKKATAYFANDAR